jgi:hypothetical protein
MTLQAERFAANPLITPSSSPTLGDNINGPSIIRAPDWLPSPLGKYYMYFAHHRGDFIRLAYADFLEGPWRIHSEGTLHLKDAKAFRDHIASPDVHVDEERKQIRMYFHGPAKNRAGQWSGVATSEDGLHFSARDTLLGLPYFRCWQWRGAWYALAKRNNDGWGDLLRSEDGFSEFESRSNFIKDMRHAAVVVRGEHLLVVYSRVGDAPERLVWATVDLASSEWHSWKSSEARDLLKPDTDYEGRAYSTFASNHGAATAVRQLRDPAIVVEADGMAIFYSVAGEEGIAGASLK